MAIRVYEYSKKSGVPSKNIITLLEENGFIVPNHMTHLSDEMIDFLNKQNNSKDAAIKNLGNKKNTRNSINFKKNNSDKEIETPLKKELFHTSMTVAQFCDTTDVSANDLIVYLLKKGIVAPKNYVLSEKLVEDLAHHFNIQFSEKIVAQQSEAERSISAVKGTEKRAPIVVIVGHVDHGKTTLLDYIRKTRVAEKEKGGITQHLGAYEVLVDKDPIVFLDTPGHEAFSLIRVRGLKVADIAILVVAADDGVMPQTVESIKRIKAAGVTVIVALNKIDKATSAQIEATKRSLAQYDLLPEDWGGQTVVVPISAKLGTGVADLLEVIHLQSQIMDLFTNTKAQAKGFVLESKIEKGRGLVATLITHQGTLKIGDYFICDLVQGRVASLTNSQGIQVKQVLPAMPVAITGFDMQPQVGALLEVVSAEEYKLHKNKNVERVSSMATMHTTDEAVTIVIRSDNMSSKEAILGEIERLSKKSFKPLHVVSAGIGMITESDVELAHETHAIIYGFNIKIDKQAAREAQKMGVAIKVHDIIYKLLEDLELLAEQGKPVKKVLKKMGEAVVLKVFDIKGVGVVAGAQVKSGRFVKEGGKVLIYRGKYKAGEGSLKSLQRDKKTVKEVQAGFECAFMVDNFSDWIVDDRVECFIEVPE
ncbi:MAG: translation initiation factor IF-2 [Candidatus Babeliaceae bacterium]|nr:translation initiation factor IF-2 [Candidatus Babeliaceae bacterium]